MNKDMILNKLPEWLRDSIVKVATKEDFNGNYDGVTPVCDLSDETLICWLNDCSRDWLDHWGVCDGRDNKVVLSSNPYCITEKAMKQVILFCEKYNCTFYVAGNSDYSKEACNLVLHEKD